jgi:hypothetical protein
MGERTFLEKVIAFIWLTFFWGEGGGVRLSPLGTSATIRPTAPTPDDG